MNVAVLRLRARASAADAAWQVYVTKISALTDVMANDAATAGERALARQEADAAHGRFFASFVSMLVQQEAAA